MSMYCFYNGKSKYIKKNRKMKKGSMHLEAGKDIVSERRWDVGSRNAVPANNR